MVSSNGEKNLNHSGVPEDAWACDRNSAPENKPESQIHPGNNEDILLHKAKILAIASICTGLFSPILSYILGSSGLSKCQAVFWSSPHNVREHAIKKASVIGIMIGLSSLGIVWALFCYRLFILW